MHLLCFLIAELFQYGYKSQFMAKLHKDSPIYNFIDILTISADVYMTRNLQTSGYLNILLLFTLYMYLCNETTLTNNKGNVK